MFFTKRKAIILIIICSIFFILTYNDVRSEEIKEISGNEITIDFGEEWGVKYLDIEWAPIKFD